jgi:c-di-AMP phosphodiesterase-like protein
MEKTAYIILIIVTIAWIIAWVIGIFENVWLGIIGLVTIVGLGLLFVKALTDRLASKKDDKYSKDVEK